MVTNTDKIQEVKGLYSKESMMEILWLYTRLMSYNQALKIDPTESNARVARSFLEDYKSRVSLDIQSELNKDIFPFSVSDLEETIKKVTKSAFEH